MSLPSTAADDVDRVAIDRFRVDAPAGGLAPLAIVIAAYNEADSIGPVIDAIPREVCGLAVDIVVVDDGSRDATAEVAARHGALVVRPGVNRGQGAALRLGYRVARECGAQLIATTDADGQYDASELPLIIEPLVSDAADFVSGSRVLGRALTTDRMRLAGVRVYARLLTLLTRRHITDPANGFRAMRADLTAAVTLEQPQYQATELLIGAVYRGFRTTERATTMHMRSSGASKKGGNLLYGYRFGRVIIGTWWRELRRNRREGRTLASAAPRTDVVV